MTNKELWICSVTCGVTMLVVALLYGCQTIRLADAHVIDTKGKRSLKLTAEYKANILQDISTDGRLLLFYQTSRPTRSYTIPLDRGRSRPNQAPVSDDVLRVVERASGREVGRVTVNFFPENAQFIPGTEKVFYKEPSGSKSRWEFKVWNFSTGDAKACSDGDAVNFRHVRVVDVERVLGAELQENGGESLVRMILSECRVMAINSVNPTNPGSMTWGGLNISPDQRYLAYGTGEEVIVRDATTLNTVKRIKPPSGLIFGGSPIYTPDGKFLLVLASSTIFDKQETNRFLIFYQTANYEVARRIDITNWSPPVLKDDVAIRSNVLGTAMAISPDSRVLAVGYTREERKASSTTLRAEVILYDLATAEEIGRASHPSVRSKGNDPFAAKIGKLVFTPDGKHLLSSTHDTLAWEILGKDD